MMKDDLPVRGVWSSRLALFSLLLTATALFLHRLLELPTPTFFVYLGAAWILSLSALLLALWAFWGLWRERSQGAARIVLGGGIGSVMILAPVLILGVARDYPMLNDMTTNILDPPLYSVLEKERKGIANPIRYPMSQFALLQKKAYPDLGSLTVKRSAQDTFDLILDILQRFQTKIVVADPPTDLSPVGRIEAVHRTLLLGFYNDIAVRIRGDKTSAMVDLRSSSRYGKSDFGYNAKILRYLMRELSSKVSGTTVLPSRDPEGSSELSPSKQEKKESPKKGAPGR